MTLECTSRVAVCALLMSQVPDDNALVPVQFAAIADCRASTRLSAIRAAIINIRPVDSCYI